jgi:succinate dehydrogenase/fumarate reductase flavoprotein subunit
MENGLNRRLLLAGLGLMGAIPADVEPAEAISLPAGVRRERYDVVVVGLGTAGLVAALQAQQSGANVLALEKMADADSGGDSRMSGGIFFVPGQDTPDSRRDFVADNDRVTDGRGNTDLFRVMAEHAWPDIDWLKQQGCAFLEFEPALLGTGGVVTLTPAPWHGMPQFIATMQDRFTRLGGKIAYNTKAQQLILDDHGRVAGVKAETSDGLVDYMANAVIIAAGGYCANKFMLEQLVHPEADAMLVRGSKVATGDGHRMALEAGGALQNMAGMKTVSVVAVDPRQPAGANPEKALRRCIAINRNGERYVDESQGLLINGRAALDQPGQIVALVFDETIRQAHETQMSIETFQKLNLPVIEADTLEELARQIKVPPAALKATVDAFNASVQGSAAPGAHPPKGALAFKVATPKFYAFYPLVPAITQTFGAIVTNAQAQVLEPDGRVIPGLYAAGNCAGPLYYDNYWPGGMQTACLVMGRVAGRSAASVRL